MCVPLKFSFMRAYLNLGKSFMFGLSSTPIVWENDLNPSFSSIQCINKDVSTRLNTQGEYNPFISTCSSWDNKWWKITGTDIIQKPQNPINDHRNNKFKRGLSSLALSYKNELVKNMNRTFSIHRKYKQIWTVKNIITNSIRKSSKTKQNIRNYNDGFKKTHSPGH